MAGNYCCPCLKMRKLRPTDFKCPSQHHIARKYDIDKTFQPYTNSLWALRIGVRSSTLVKDNFKHKGFCGSLRSGISPMATFNLLETPTTYIFHSVYSAFLPN